MPTSASHKRSDGVLISYKITVCTNSDNNKLVTQENNEIMYLIIYFLNIVLA